MSAPAGAPYPTRLLLVDGSGLLFQMFYGMPARIVNGEGKAYGGTLGFIGALRRILQMVQPTHAAVFFDGEHENPRTGLDAGYKANRPDFSAIPGEDTPFSQLPDVYAALDFLGIRHAETTDCEADDLIAAYCAQCGADVQVVIASQDHDFFQLLSARVTQLRYRGKATQLCTPAYVRGKFGIEPEQYAHFRALTGDTTDNIRGAEKIGPKTAAALLQTFGTLEGILSGAPQIQKPSVRESILRNAEQLKRNYALIRLGAYVALPFPLETLVYTPRSCTTKDVLRGIGL